MPAIVCQSEVFAVYMGMLHLNVEMLILCSHEFFFHALDTSHHPVPRLRHLRTCLSKLSLRVNFFSGIAQVGLGQ
jgi:hypothetical protein